MGLITPPGKITAGEVIFEGQDLLKYKANGPEMRAIRGGKIAMIFQEPMTSLNPVLTIGHQLQEILELHLGMHGFSSREKAIELLTMVGIQAAAKRLEDYPHQFSGGMRQRVMIAMGLSCNPKLLIADEPTTALDVTTQAQLLELMKTMVEKFHSSLVIVTHNLGSSPLCPENLHYVCGENSGIRHLQRHFPAPAAPLYHRSTTVCPSPG
jgi:ABC-type dipeptide/oligopeptide/nickel transport system ATPase component